MNEEHIHTDPEHCLECGLSIAYSDGVVLEYDCCSDLEHECNPSDQSTEGI